MTNLATWQLADIYGAPPGTSETLMGVTCS